MTSHDSLTPVDLADAPPVCVGPGPADWDKDEIRKALDRERHDGRDIIIPLMVDRYLLDGWEDGLAADLRSRLAADFTGWESDNSKFEEQFERVVSALRTDEVGGAAGAASIWAGMIDESRHG